MLACSVLSNGRNTWVVVKAKQPFLLLIILFFALIAQEVSVNFATGLSSYFLYQRVSE